MLENLKAKVEGKVPVCGAVSETLVVTVDVKLLHLDEIAEIYIDNIESIENVRLDSTFKESFKRYLYTLYAVRLYRVTNNTKNVAAYKSFRFYKVPAVWAAILDLIGPVADPDTNIIIRPNAEIELGLLLSDEEMWKFSVSLNRFKRSLALVSFPDESKGDLSFMSKILIDNEIRSYRREDHPIYALLSSIVTKETAEAAFLAMCRITYGTVELLWHAAPEVVMRHDS